MIVYLLNLLCRGGLLSLSVALFGCRVESRVLELTPSRQRPLTLSWNEGATAQAPQDMTLESYGESVRTILPSKPTSLAGYGGIQRRLLPPRLNTGDKPTVFCKPYRTVESPPRLKVSVYSGSGRAGPTALILVNLDVVAVTQDVSQWLLDTARAVLGDTIELGQAHLQVTATHTHSGPAGLSLSPFWTAFACDTPQEFYREEVEATFRSALREAWDNPIALRALRTVRTEIAGFNESRISSLTPSTTTHLWLPLEASSGEPVGCLFSYPVHSTLKGPDSLALDRDLAGLLEDSLAEELNLKNCFFWNGAAGNARARLNGKTPQDYARSLTNRIASRTRAASDANETPPTEPTQIRDQTHLSFQAIKLQLPRARMNFNACRLDGLAGLLSPKILDDFPRITKIAWVRMDNDLTLFLPGEIVSNASAALSEKLKEADPTLDQITFVTTANDYTGYVLRPTDYDGHSLEACSSLFGSEHLNKILKTLVKSIRTEHQ